MNIAHPFIVIVYWKKYHETIVMFNRNRNYIMIFLPVQCRMARAALGMGVRDLAAAAKVAIDTVARFERGEELKERTIDALRLALEEAGVEFTNGGQPGVRLKQAPVSKLDRMSASNSRRAKGGPAKKASKGS
jgi:transcriptional regulator with XRE-family HTH domain